MAKIMVTRTIIENKTTNKNPTYKYCLNYDTHRVGIIKLSLLPDNKYDIYGETEIYNLLNLIYANSNEAELIHKKNEIKNWYDYFICAKNPNNPNEIIECPMSIIYHSNSYILNYIFQHTDYLSSQN